MSERSSRPMGSSAASYPDGQTPRAAPRRPNRFVIAGISAALLACAGWAVWLCWVKPPSRDLREIARQGRAYLRQGRPDLAFQAVSDARDDEPGADEAVTVAATALIRMGQIKVARLALERSLRINPNQFEASVTLAELHAELGNGTRSAEVFEAATRLRPREQRVWLALGNVLMDLSEPLKAVSAYERVLELNPKHRAALVGIVRGWLLGNAPAQADPWVAAAIREFPDDPVILGLAARQAIAEGHTDEALVRAERALARDPENADALVARVRALIAGSNWDQALPSAERAVAAVPSDLDTIQLLHLVETRLGLTERAAATLDRRNRVLAQTQTMERLQREIELHPDNAELRAGLGKAALESGATLLASRCFEAALALDPSCESARENLAAIRAQQKGAAPSPRPTRDPASGPAGIPGGAGK